MQTYCRMNISIKLYFKKEIDLYKRQGRSFHMDVKTITTLIDENLGSNQVFKNIFECPELTIWYKDLVEDTLWMTNGMASICGYTQEELMENPMLWTQSVSREDQEALEQAMNQLLLGEPTRVEYRIIRPDGQVRWIQDRANPVLNQGGKVIALTGTVTDITSQKEEIIRLKNQLKGVQALGKTLFEESIKGMPSEKTVIHTNTSVETMLDNTLYSCLSSELTQAKENRQNLAVLFMDLDRFKAINDTLGHTTGDQLLRIVGKRIKDSLADHPFIFKQSGDKFIIVLKDANRDEASNVCRRILNDLEAPFKIQNYDLFTSSSIGVSVYPEDGDTVEILLTLADYAMYQAKKQGKNNYKFYSSKELEGSMNPIRLEMDLHKAIQQDELILHYQPKVSLKTGKIVGVEALVRWNHPELGIISPGNFIPIAEETGLIIPIGEWVLYHACKQNKEWQQTGFKTTVSVNVSARQFTQSIFDETVSRILRETELKPQFLEIEISDSMTANIERTITTLQNLKKLGVQISIDDFGTGFSSLNYLQKFPIDNLKIDQSLVHRMESNMNDKTIVTTIISMAHNLNLNVIAEGIQTKEQLIYLQQHLCDEGQGYLFTKPMTADKMLEAVFEVENVVKDFGLPQDVNERMWAEELVRLARKELNETIHLQQGMIFKYKKINGQFIHTLCDGELLYRMGLIPNLVVGKQLQDFLPEEIACEKLEHYERAWNGEENVSYEEEINGIHYLATLSPIKRGGEVVEVIASCFDITDRKKAERALLESENKYRLIAENMTDLLILFDINGYGIYASPSHESVLGYSPEYFESNNTYNLIHPEDVALTKMQFEKIIRSKSPSKMELRLSHANGDWKLLECTGTPVLSEKGKVEHIMVVAKDITEKRRAEELLWNSEKLSLVGELAAGVAHEIRNPITAIKGFIQLFQQGLIRDEYFDIILSEFDRIEGIIKEFLSLAKPQEIQPKPVNITTLVKEVETLIKSEAHLKNIEFTIESQQDIPDIMCDANQIKQVLLNLCKNSMEAIDLTRKGLIKITVLVEKEDLLINVIDNGIGISEERLKRLGEPFYSNKEKGTGLGLMLCFRIIRQHNGSLTFHSKENKGTTSQVRLPLS
jgi:diguanylate cyclase (GGDEF)-like protein/PAS domain S-box-containing protein